jgi:hypothetical protein
MKVELETRGPVLMEQEGSYKREFWQIITGSMDESSAMRQKL